MTEGTFKTGYVALIGRPNAGKSTLLNRILGSKLAITSAKAQTTRNRIVGIHTDDETQVILVDTPGLHEAWTELNKSMVSRAREVIDEVETTEVHVEMIEVLKRILDQLQPLNLLKMKWEESLQKINQKRKKDYSDSNLKSHPPGWFFD